VENDPLTGAVIAAVQVPLQYKGVTLQRAARLDLIIESRVVVEIKAVERIDAVHYAQLNTYLRLTGLPVGLLINFNVRSLRLGLRRICF
jgi:GxxExxY protein